MENQLLQKVINKLNVVGGPDEDGKYTAWCPFHNDGHGTPPHHPNLTVWPNGFYCNACGEKGTIRQLALHLKITSAKKKTSVRKRIYPYKNECGDLLFQVIRGSDKSFYQRRPDGKGGYINNLQGVEKVLYRLPELIAQPKKRVFIVEGEKDVENLIKLGCLATTNPGGAGKWSNKFNKYIENRHVIILPDNDEPGHKHAQKVARSIHEVAKSIKIIELPGLDEKGDVSDWIEKGHTKEELEGIVRRSESWNIDQNSDVVSDCYDEKVNAEKIIQLIEDTGIEFFHDERKKPYARIVTTGGRHILSLTSEQFKNWLSHLIWEKTHKPLGSESLATAIRTLQGKARFDNPEYKLRVRIARHDDSIFIDIDGTKAIEVSHEGWKIIPEPPILFRPNTLQCSLPEPAESGDLKSLLNFVNVGNEDSRLLLLCYLVAALIPDIPIAILTIHGIQGTAKTTLLKIVKKLLDPSVVEVQGAIKNISDFSLVAWRNRVLIFDNLTYVTQELSDALCRAVTGEGITKRTLYTDEDITFFEYKRAIGLAGINLVANSPDLLDRSLIISLDPISPEQRKNEQRFWEEFNKAYPQIFRGLLDTLVRTIDIEPSVDLDSSPRLADFVRWSVAAAKALGYTEEAYMNAYNNNILQQNEYAIEASPVATAVVEFMQNREVWEGTATNLLGSLTKLAEESLCISVNSRIWPRTSYILSRKLKEVEKNLNFHGIEIEHYRSAKMREIILRKTNDESSLLS